MQAEAGNQRLPHCEGLRLSQATSACSNSSWITLKSFLVFVGEAEEVVQGKGPPGIRANRSTLPVCRRPRKVPSPAHSAAVRAAAGAPRSR